MTRLTSPVALVSNRTKHLLTYLLILIFVTSTISLSFNSTHIKNILSNSQEKANILAYAEESEEPVDYGFAKVMGGGQQFTVALTDDGEIYSWGKNDVGQLGLGQTGDKSVPQRLTDYVPELKGWSLQK